MIDFQLASYMLILETAIQCGLPVILQNVQEALDPALEPLLTKSICKVGTCVYSDVWFLFQVPV